MNPLVSIIDNLPAKRGWIYAGYALLIFIVFIGLFKCRWKQIAETLYRLQNMLLLTLCALLFAGMMGYRNYSESNKMYFAVEMGSSVSGTSQVFFDVGRGYNETDSIAWHVKGGDVQTYSLLLPALSIKSIRFDPINLPSEISVKKAWIKNAVGETTKIFPFQSFMPNDQIGKIDVSEDVMVIHTTENANDPQTIIENSSFDRLASWRDFLAKRGWIYAGYALLSFILFMWLAKCRFTKIALTLERLVNYSVANPRKAIMFIGLLASVASCYPVVFFGMSFVSPLGAAALYSGPPWIPGFPFDAAVENLRGSDIGATAWCIAPNAVVQHDSIFRYFEFPFWNRYVGGGLPLFAQGQSMIGDVLHWIPIFLDGSAIGWDIKFVLSKAIFAVGIGLLVFRLTDRLIAGILIAISSCFIGFFAFRYNHPAFFVLTYAPWVALQWDRLGRILALPNPHLRSCILQGFLLAVLTWLQLNAGTPKEGVITACFMQAFGVLAFWVHISPKWGRIRSCVLACGIGLALVMITAPHWLLFLDALSKAYTLSDTAGVSTMPLWSIAGFFENFFFQAQWGTLVAPSLNLFILFCMSSALVSLRLRQSDMVYGAWGLFVLAMCIAYGLIPPSVLMAIPFIDKIQHVGNTFSVPMMVLALIIAGYGIRDYLIASKGRKTIILFFSLIIFGSLWLTFALKADHYKNITALAYVVLFVTIIGFAQLYRHIDESSSWKKRGGAILLICCFLLLHVRHGMHLAIGIEAIDAYVMNPTERGDYSNKSNAVEYVRNEIEKARMPTRVIGEGLVLFPGINVRYGLEGIVPVDAIRNNNYEKLLTLIDYPEYQGWRWLRLIKSDQIVSRAASLDLLGIGYMLAEGGTKMPQDVKLVHSSDLDVWQRASVWPRAFFVNQITEVLKPSDILDALANKLHTPFAAVESQFIPRGVLSINAPYRVVPAREYRLTNNSTHFSVEASGSGIIVLSETYYSGDFIAKVNGEMVDYVRVNEASKGIWVNKAGKYDVSFTYRPEKLNQAIWICLFGLALLLLLLRVFVGTSWGYKKVVDGSRK